MLDLEPSKLEENTLHKKKSNGKVIISGSNCILMKKKKDRDEDSVIIPSLNSTPLLSVLQSQSAFSRNSDPILSKDAISIRNTINQKLGINKSKEP